MDKKGLFYLVIGVSIFWGLPSFFRGDGFFEGIAESYMALFILLAGGFGFFLFFHWVSTRNKSVEQVVSFQTTESAKSKYENSVVDDDFDYLYDDLDDNNEYQFDHFTIPGETDFTEVINQHFQQAEAQGWKSIVLNSGNIHREVGNYPSPEHNMPVCHKVMRSLMRLGDKVVQEPQKASSGNLDILYNLPR